jgi:hypothetical protein
MSTCELGWSDSGVLKPQKALRSRRSRPTTPAFSPESRERYCGTKERNEG